MPDDTRLTPPPVLASSAPSARWDLPRTPFAFIWRYMRGGFFAPIALMVLLYGLAAGFDTAQAFVIGKLVNTIGGDHADDALLWFVGLCVTWFGTYAWLNAFGAASNRMQIQLRVRIHDDLFAYLLEHAPRYFLDHVSGTLAHKIRTAGSAAAALIDFIATHTLRFTILFAVTGVMVARTAPEMLLPAAAFVILIFVGLPLLARRLRVYAKASSHASAEQAGRMGDTALNWELVRGFTANTYERAALGLYNEREADAFMRLRLGAIRVRLILHSISFVFLAWLAWVSLTAALRGDISAGTFATLVTLYLMISAHVRNLGDAVFGCFENFGLLSDALSTVLRPHEIVDPPGARPLRVDGGAISIRDIDFSYPDGTPVFRNFSLEIAAGEKVGLVGTSGAGKSTLIKVIRRQFPLQAGAILIDGQDVSGITWDSVHDAFAEVPQNPGMFHRSVHENIVYGRPDATEAEVVAAAKLAHCHEFIASRVQGYDSIVGEKGMKLSGGERQRVAIARAFLKNAPILLLDEATSSLDSEAEHLIQEALLTLMRGRTVIAIAHRLSTIMHVDRIIVLEDGHTIEQGTHAALLAKGGTYARLWQRQAGGFM